MINYTLAVRLFIFTRCLKGALENSLGSIYGIEVYMV